MAGPTPISQSTGRNAGSDHGVLSMFSGAEQTSVGCVDATVVRGDAHTYTGNLLKTTVVNNNTTIIHSPLRVHTGSAPPTAPSVPSNYWVAFTDTRCGTVCLECYGAQALKAVFNPD